jgi:spore coat protein A, manganese oxidase
MANRRDFFKYTALAGAGAVGAKTLLASQSATAAVLGIGNAPTVTVGNRIWKELQFKQPLPIPPIAMPYSVANGEKWYVMLMRPLLKRILPVIPGMPYTATRVYGYSFQDDNGFSAPCSPGPTIFAYKNSQIKVMWINQLGTYTRTNAGPEVFNPDTSYLTTIRGYNGPDVPIPNSTAPPLADSYSDTINPEDINVHPHTTGILTTTHLHGAAFVSQVSDGDPTQAFGSTGSLWATYPNTQDEAPLWYHDHALGKTRLNVYAGLAGAYIIGGGADFGYLRDNYGVILPRPQYDIPLIIQDKQLSSTGDSLLYRVSQQFGYPWKPEVFGDIMTVNGAAWPYMDVEPRVYRFRIYNGCGSRVLNIGADNINKIYIGGDQGLFRSAFVNFTGKVLLAPGQRLDMLIDFSNVNTNTITLVNDAQTPYPVGGFETSAAVSGGQMGQIMQFRVSGPSLGNTTPITSITTLRPATGAGSIPNPTTVTVSKTRRIVLHEITDPQGHVGVMQPRINNRTFNHIGDNPIGDPTTDAGNPIARPATGVLYEQWDIANTTADTHPIHLHLFRVQVKQRQALTAAFGTAYVSLIATTPAYVPESTGGINPYAYVTGAVTLATPTENGWLDTVQVPPGKVTSIIVEIPAGSPTGIYPLHCHILEHEDNEMMRRFVVT